MSLADDVAAVFARLAPIADLMFSRTGVARVGDRPMVWCPPARCFLNQASGQPGTFAVMPARYGVFLAKTRLHRVACTACHARKPDQPGRSRMLPIGIARQQRA